MKKTAIKDQTLLEILKSMYPDSSGRTIKNFLEQKRVTVDGAVVSIGKHLVKEGQEVAVGKLQRPAIQEFEILFEDEHLAAIDKPAGLLSVPLDKGNSKNALTILRNYFRSPYVYSVHRIDRDTSGVMVFVRTREARAGMDKLFKTHDLTREYIALVEGHVKTPKGTWESRLAERSVYEVYATDDPEEGQHAVTHYEVIRTTPRCTWLLLTLETGRKHQIRIHCRDAGHPVLGDKTYGGGLNPYKRLCLHAHRLSFKHPITGELLDIKAKPVEFIKIDRI